MNSIVWKKGVSRENPFMIEDDTIYFGGVSVSIRDVDTPTIGNKKRPMPKIFEAKTLYALGWVAFALGIAVLGILFLFNSYFEWLLSLSQLSGSGYTKLGEQISEVSGVAAVLGFADVVFISLVRKIFSSFSGNGLTLKTRYGEFFFQSKDEAYLREVNSRIAARRTEIWQVKHETKIESKTETVVIQGNNYGNAGSGTNSGGNGNGERREEE